jgi:hypothetical protein
VAFRRYSRDDRAAMADAHAAPPEAAPAPRRGGRARPWIVRLLIGLATLLAIIATFGAWADRQLLNTQNWVDTTDELIADERIQAAIARFVATDIVDTPQARQRIEDALPTRAAPLAGPIAGAVSDLADRATRRLLATAEVQKLWSQANRLTHQQFVKAVDGEKPFTDQGIILDLRPLDGTIGQKLGVAEDVTRLGDNGRIVIIKPNQLESLQTGVHLFKILRWVTAILAFVLFAAAVYVAPDRRRTLLNCGLALMVAGLFVLLMRRVLGDAIVQAVTSGGPSAPAANDAWHIGTSMLRDIAASGVVLGVIVALGAWLAGAGRRATATRRFIAPVLRDQPAIAGSIVGIVVLILLLAGVLPGSDRIIPVLIYIALVVAGMVLLRRQVTREFPAAHL